MVTSIRPNYRSCSCEKYNYRQESKLAAVLRFRCGALTNWATEASCRALTAGRLFLKCKPLMHANRRLSTLMQLLFSIDRCMRVEKTLIMQTLACQLSCNSCSRLIKQWKLRKLSCKLSLVNSHATFVLVSSSNESWKNSHTNSLQLHLYRWRVFVRILSVCIIVVAPLEHTGREYHTDEGVIVPCISVQLRNKLIRVSGQFSSKS
jgi:hypothetical protein